MLPIHLPKDSKNLTVDELLTLSKGPIIACDFYVEGAETWQQVPGGYEFGNIVNIDHHADTKEMARKFSSANLALERVRSIGQPPADALVVITHADCDSILSAGIMSGRLGAEDRYGEAAIAADHSGDENAIADLLQALDKERDIELSFDALARLEARLPQSELVQGRLAERRAKRLAAAEIVWSGKVAMRGNLAVGDFEQAIDGEFFAPLLPHAAIIMLVSPLAVNIQRLEVKLRLGRGAPEALSLHALGIQSFDPAYGGRWNAGSNKRGGGTALALDEYVARLSASLDAWEELRQ